MIELVSVSKNIGHKKLLNNINLKVKPGEKIGIVGPSGSGKTTLLRVILGIYKTSGGILKSKVKNIGFMPSNQGLYEKLTVKENIKAYTGMNICNNKDLIDISKEIGVFDYLNEKVDKLSSVLKLKISLLISLFNNPELLILDEPTLNLDLESKMNIKILLKEYMKDKTLIITSQKVSEVENICDRVIFIENGELQTKDSLQKLRLEFSDERVKIILNEKISLEEKRRIKSDFASVKIYENYILFNEEKVDMNLILNMVIRLGLNIFEIKREIKILQDICLDIRRGDLNSEGIIE